MSNHSASAPTWITCDYLEKMLRNSLKNESIHVYDFDIGPGSSFGDNYASQVFRIRCFCSKPEDQKETISIIAKLIPNTDLAEKLNKGFDLYKTEIKMMSETLELVYGEIRSKTDTERFFPKFYKMDFENKMLFMQDLKTEGYVLTDRTLSLDLDHVVLVVKALATMHAGSYLLLQKIPDYKNNYLDSMFDGKEGSFLTTIAEATRKYFLGSLHLWPISEEDKDNFRKLKFYDLAVDSYARKDSSFNVLLHGDCWINNIMFKYQNRKPVSVKLLDYQLSNYNAIGLDLNHFLFTSATENVKLEHLEDILQTYYDTFVSVTGAIPGFTLDTVRKEFTERMGFGFFMGYLLRPAMTGENRFDLEASVENRESENNNKMYQNERFISEAEKLLPLFKKYGAFK